MKYVYQWRAKDGRMIDSAPYDTYAEADFARSVHAQYNSSCTEVLELPDDATLNYGHANGKEKDQADARSRRDE